MIRRHSGTEREPVKLVHIYSTMFGFKHQDILPKYDVSDLIKQLEIKHSCSKVEFSITYFLMVAQNKSKVPQNVVIVSLHLHNYAIKKHCKQIYQSS